MTRLPDWPMTCEVCCESIADAHGPRQPGGPRGSICCSYCAELVRVCGLGIDRTLTLSDLEQRDQQLRDNLLGHGIQARAVRMLTDRWRLGRLQALKNRSQQGGEPT